VLLAKLRLRVLGLYLSQNTSCCNWKSAIFPPGHISSLYCRSQ